MKKGISRAKARLSIVLLALTLAALIVGYFVDGIITTVVAAVFAIAAILCRIGKCPTCGKGASPMPQWSRPGKYHCPYCGTRFAYDDEEEEA